MFRPEVASVGTPAPQGVQKIMQQLHARPSATSTKRPRREWWRTAGCADFALVTGLTQNALEKEQHPSLHVRSHNARGNMLRVFMR
jgi:hypothetical protein